MTSPLCLKKNQFNPLNFVRSSHFSQGTKGNKVHYKHQKKTCRLRCHRKQNGSWDTGTSSKEGLEGNWVGRKQQRDWRHVMCSSHHFCTLAKAILENSWSVVPLEGYMWILQTRYRNPMGLNAWVDRPPSNLHKLLEELLFLLEGVPLLWVHCAPECGMLEAVTKIAQCTRCALTGQNHPPAGDWCTMKCAVLLIAISCPFLSDMGPLRRKKNLAYWVANNNNNNNNKPPTCEMTQFLFFPPVLQFSITFLDAFRFHTNPLTYIFQWSVSFFVSLPGL